MTEEYIALDKKLEPIEEELFDLIKKMPLAVEKKIKGKICVIPSGLKTDEELICRVRKWIIIRKNKFGGYDIYMYLCRMENITV